MKIIVYTYFGRTLNIFDVSENETHHNALKKARKYLLDKEKSGTKCWIKLKRI